MSGCSRRCFSAFALILSGVIAAPWAFAETTYSFNLPEQSLADSLRAIGQQTEMNILFEPDAVKNARSPALRGQYTVDEAIRLVLAGTKLEAQHTATNNVVIKVRSARSTVLPATSVDAPGNSGIRLAQSNSGSPQPQSTAGPQNTDTSNSTSESSKKEGLEEIVVTGTHIRGAPHSSPLTVVDRSDIDNSGYLTTGDVIRSLPIAFSGAQNPGVVGAPGAANGNNFANASSANLRGLGPEATLTLIDGHRFAYNGVNNVVDLSIIPVVAIEQIQIVPDGSSATYGSDAVAGVVNVILRKNYDGTETSFRGGGSHGGGGTARQFDELVGKSWSTGGFVATYEYRQQDALRASQRAFSSGAEAPTDLLPYDKRNSALLTAHQDLAPFAAAFLEGIFSDASTTSDTSTATYQIDLPTTVRQYGGATGVNLVLPARWRATMQGEASNDETRVTENLYATNGASLGTTLYNFTNKLRSISIDADGLLASIPGGDLALAVGLGYRHEQLVTNYTGREDAERAIKFAYLEANVPIINAINEVTGISALTLSLTARREDYDTFGATTVPKVGFSYEPIPAIVIRGTWGRSFRAPSLYEELGPRSAYSTPARALGITAPPGATALVVGGGNRELAPEKSRSWNFGVDYKPTGDNGLDLGASVFQIFYTNRIVSPLNSVIGIFGDPIYRPFIRQYPTEAQVGAAIDGVDTFRNRSGGVFDPASVIAIFERQFQNVADQTAEGVDLTARYSINSAVGKFGFMGWSAWLRIRQKDNEVSPEREISGTIFNPPRNKFRLGSTWEKNRWSGAAFLNFVSSETDNSAGFVAGSTAANTHVASWTTVDAQLSYRMPFHQVRDNLMLTLSVQNLFDRQPPSVSSQSTTYGGLNYDSSNASALGRFVSATFAVRTR